MKLRMARVSLSLSLAAALACPSLPAAAQDADTREVQRYVLTDAALSRYSQAVRKLTALPGGKTVACDSEEPDSQSIRSVVAKLEAIPGARASLQSSGLTAREYVVFTFSLLQNGLASWASSQPGGKLPAGISQANVDFVRRHDAELKRIAALQPKDACDDQEGDGRR